MPKDPSPSAFGIRISLVHVRPEIWRVLRVPADIRMDRLHNVLQAAMGWTDSHLHQYHLFDAEGHTRAYVGGPDPEFDSDPPKQDETKRLLKNFLAKAGDRIGYEYDFGDGWLHDIRLESVAPQATRLSRALCLDGARACPPEDCGGPPGFEAVLDAVANPKPRNAELRGWLGYYDPAAFDLAAVNRALSRIRV